MTAFLWNIILALAWTALSGQLSAGNLMIGFILGFIVLFFSRRVIGSASYFGKLGEATGFILFFVWELVLSSLRVAYDVLRPQHRFQSGVIALPLDITSDAEITLLANLISLTPGTLSLDVSQDRKTLFIHAMYIDEDGVEGLKQKLKRGFETRVAAVLR